MTDEKRRFTRISMDCRAILEGEGLDPIEGRLTDLSVKGMQVHLDAPLQLPAVVKFQILLGDEEPVFTIEGDAEVVRAGEDGNVGLYLLRMDVESLTHLRRLVELNLGDSEQAAEEISKW